LIEVNLMISRKLLILAATAIVLLFNATAKSQEHSRKVFSVRLGDAEIIIPTPEGFEEASSQFEKVKANFSATESPDNDMLAVYLTASDCELLRQGKQPSMAFYTKVSVLRARRMAPFSTEDLAAVKAEFRKNGAGIMDPNGPQMKAQLQHIEEALSSRDSTKMSVDISKPVNLGEFDVRPNVYGVLLMITFKIASNSGESATPLLAGMSFTRVKDRLVYFFTYRKYQSKADVDILTAFTTKWTTMILGAN
jgi:hypothetical protein